MRCKMIVKSVLTDLGIKFTSVELGVAELEKGPTTGQRKQIKAGLHLNGLELMEDRKAILVEKVKSLVIEMIHYADEMPLVKKSVYISQKLDYDYTYLANLFSEVTGTTIEQYIIAHKIEKVKELILYNELTLTQIAYKMHYSSPAHLSAQFKKVTGLTPSYFKTLKNKRLQSLEDVGNV
jgi:AraC-like DNA-binding protein